jgi:SEC-C motif domain protein
MNGRHRRKAAQNPAYRLLRMSHRTLRNARCPCDPTRALDACCGRYLDGGLAPETPEALMRSRYSAYVLGRALYLRESWHPRTRPERVVLDDGTTWLGLEVLRAEQQDDAHATVEFVAR